MENIGMATTINPSSTWITRVSVSFTSSTVEVTGVPLEARFPVDLDNIDNPGPHPTATTSPTASQSTPGAKSSETNSHGENSGPTTHTPDVGAIVAISVVFTVAIVTLAWLVFRCVRARKRMGKKSTDSRHRSLVLAASATPSNRRSSVSDGNKLERGSSVRSSRSHRTMHSISESDESSSLRKISMQDFDKDSDHLSEDSTAYDRSKSPLPPVRAVSTFDPLSLLGLGAGSRSDNDGKETKARDPASEPMLAEKTTDETSLLFGHEEEIEYIKMQQAQADREYGDNHPPSLLPPLHVRSKSRELGPGKGVQDFRAFSQSHPVPRHM